MASTSALRRPTAGSTPGRFSTLQEFDAEFKLQMQKVLANTSLSSASSSSPSASTSTAVDSYRLYTKGMVVEDRSGVKLGAIAVAIFNSFNDVVLESSEPLGVREGEIMTETVADLEAFLRGLEFALRLDLKDLLYTSLQFNVSNYINVDEEPKEAKVAELVHDVLLLKERFQQCDSSPAIKENAQLVLNLVRFSIEKQGGMPLKDIVPSQNNCRICLEDVDDAEMLEFHTCPHRFCSSCITQHVQLKVRNGELPKCPQLDCGVALSIDICKMLLDPKPRILMERLVRESSIAPVEKVYCPNPRCSNLMSKAEALATRCPDFTNRLDALACRCTKCYSLFCLSCKVLWHSNMSCKSYKIGESFWNSRSLDAKLKMLVTNNKWRKCPRCSHMVELASGCNHISCRCGHEFCYVCGREWRKKRPTCLCPLWHEANIIHQ